MKITRSTIKSFLNKNIGKVYIKVKSDFDGMQDCVVSINGSFSLAEPETKFVQETLGIKNAWFVGSSRDYFQSFEDDIFVGYRVSNCCGCFYLAVKKDGWKS